MSGYPLFLAFLLGVALIVYPSGFLEPPGVWPIRVFTGAAVCFLCAVTAWVNHRAARQWRLINEVLDRLKTGR